MPSIIIIHTWKGSILSYPIHPPVTLFAIAPNLFLNAKTQSLTAYCTYNPLCIEAPDPKLSLSSREAKATLKVTS